MLAFGIVLAYSGGAAGIQAEILVAILVFMVAASVVFGFLYGSYGNLITNIAEAVKETDERDDEAVTQREPIPDPSDGKIGPMSDPASSHKTVH